MDIIISLVIGIIIGASGTFTVGAIVFIAVKVAAEQKKFSLFSEITRQLEADPKPTPKKKAKNGRRKTK